MSSVSLVLEALCFAKHAHNGQTRGSSWATIPYFMHCVEVVEILTKYDACSYGSTDIYSVGFLHDVVEDTKYTLKDIEILFGHNIAQQVELLTLPKEYATGPAKTVWQVSVMQAEDTPNSVRAVKIADKTANVIDMVRYAPNWTVAGIRGYLASALEVVEAGVSHSEESDLIAALARNFRVAHIQAVEHYSKLER